MGAAHPAWRALTLEEAEANLVGRLERFRTGALPWFDHDPKSGLYQAEMCEFHGQEEYEAALWRAKNNEQ